MERYINRFLIGLLLTSLLHFQFDFDAFVSAGLLVFFLIFFALIDNIGKTLPIKELMSFIVFLQLFISPLITYHYFDNQSTFRMFVTEELYMSYILPALIAFCLGLFVSLRKKAPIIEQLKGGFSPQVARNARRLVVIGFIFYLTEPISPVSLKFVFYLFGQLRFIGVMILLFTNYQYKWYWILFIFGEYTLVIVRGGVFYDLFVWFGFFYMLYKVRTRSTTVGKLLAISASFLIVYAIQIVKADYREVAWADEVDNQDKEELFLDVTTKKLSQENVLSETSSLDRALSRLNTGWIISKVMEHTPLREPYTNGELLANDLKNVLLPRFLFPNKAITGGKENQRKFQRFTGKRLIGSTTMRIGAFADAYVNFGFLGGWVCMFIVGLLFSLLLEWIYFMALTNKVFVIWIPFIFSYAIRMSDIQVILNFTFKALIFALIINYFFFNHRVMPINMADSNS